MVIVQQYPLRRVTVMVTGASSGLGECLAHSLASRGANLVLLSRSREKLEAMSNSIPTVKGQSIKVVVADLRRASERYEEFVEACVEVDILINNAGVSQRSNFSTASHLVGEEVIATNLLAPMTLTRALIESQRKRPRKLHVIFVSSIQAYLPLPYRSSYCASKHGLLGFAEALDMENEDRRRVAQILNTPYWPVAVTVVTLGYMNTALSAHALTSQPHVRYGRTDKNTSNGVNPEVVAERVVKDVILAAGTPPREVWWAVPWKARVVYWIRFLCRGLYRKLILKFSVETPPPL